MGMIRAASASVGGLLLAATVLVAALAVPFGIWYFTKPVVVERQRVVNQESQQFQDATVAKLRTLTSGIVTSATTDQAEMFRRQFCALYPTVEQPPADLSAAHSDYC